MRQSVKLLFSTAAGVEPQNQAQQQRADARAPGVVRGCIFLRLYLDKTCLSPKPQIVFMLRAERESFFSVQNVKKLEK